MPTRAARASAARRSAAAALDHATHVASVADKAARRPTRKRSSTRQRWRCCARRQAAPSTIRTRCTSTPRVWAVARRPRRLRNRLCRLCRRGEFQAPLQAQKLHIAQCKGAAARVLHHVARPKENAVDFECEDGEQVHNLVRAVPALDRHGGNAPLRFGDGKQAAQDQISRKKGCEHRHVTQVTRYSDGFTHLIWPLQHPQMAFMQ